MVGWRILFVLFGSVLIWHSVPSAWSIVASFGDDLFETPLMIAYGIETAGGMIFLVSAICDLWANPILGFLESIRFAKRAGR